MSGPEHAPSAASVPAPPIGGPAQPSALDVLTCPLQSMTLIEASAGTGKTWTLCSLYVRLLLERKLDVPNILVVTFTHAANGELRERIRRRLTQCLQWLDNPTIATSADPFIATYLQHLQGRGYTTAAMRERLDAAVHGFDEAAIFTIHGFCQRALSDAAFSAAMPLSLELLHDDRELRLEVANDFWRRHISTCEPPELARWLAQTDDSPQRLEALLRQRLQRPLAQLLWPDQLAEASDTVRSQLTEHSLSLHRLFEDACALWQSERKLIMQRVTLALPNLNGNVYRPGALDSAAAQWDTLCQLDSALASAGSADFDKLALLTRLKLKPNKGKQGPQEHPFFDCATQLLQRRDQAAASLDRLRQALTRRWLDEAPVALRALKRARRLTAFDDMLTNLHERLTSGSTPDLAASLAQRFPAALIDEFQDTDPLQFSIFRSIYPNADASLFLIGDPKQAIYSFRGADLHTYLKARGAASAQGTLVHNQRSSPALIDALNHLFNTHPQTFLLEGLHYPPVAPGTAPRKPFADARSGAHPAALQLWTLPTDADGGHLTRQSASAACAQACAGEIARLLQGAAQGQVTLAEQPLRAADIAVLVRTHAQGARMREALSAQGIGSVELSQASVFASPDAAALEVVLAAILEPRRNRLLRAALATDLMGLDAVALDAMQSDDTVLIEQVGRFSHWQSTWIEQGPGVMLRQLMSEVNLSVRMLKRSDGERRLTNLFHLIELLHEAARDDPAPDALVRWLGARRLRDDGGEAAQLRLESDANLVQILTIHRAKGLEYPVVFCPFLWDAGTNEPLKPPMGAVYHDDAGTEVWDLREDTLDDAQLNEVKRRVRFEARAEDMRLVYVALTRAVHRCYVVKGPFALNGNTRASRAGLLNWMVAGAGADPQIWFDQPPDDAGIDLAWQHWAAACPRSIGIAPLPGSMPTAPLPTLAPEQSGPFEARRLARIVPRGWRLGSFSSLALGVRNESSAIDHDARTMSSDSMSGPLADPLADPFTDRPGSPEYADAQSAAFNPDPQTDLNDILRFPRGAAAGDCLHAVFERISFSDRDTWAPAIEAALRRFPPESSDHHHAERWPQMIDSMVQDVVRTPLAPGLRLCDVARNRTVTEMEFALPARHLQATQLSSLLTAHGYGVPAFSFGALQGYLRGFIDLVFEHGGRYYVLDWKSNHLGGSAHDYRAAALQQAMTRSGYHLQALLYALALHRHLEQRLPDYRYDTHFGGIQYLFVRGVRPHWIDRNGQACGVHAHRPALAVIRALEQLMDTEIGA